MARPFSVLVPVDDSNRQHPRCWKTGSLHRPSRDARPCLPLLVKHQYGRAEVRCLVEDDNRIHATRRSPKFKFNFQEHAPTHRPVHATLQHPPFNNLLVPSHSYETGTRSSWLNTQLECSFPARFASSSSFILSISSQSLAVDDNGYFDKFKHQPDVLAGPKSLSASLTFYRARSGDGPRWTIHRVRLDAGARPERCDGVVGQCLGEGALKGVGVIWESARAVSVTLASKIQHGHRHATFSRLHSSGRNPSCCGELTPVHTPN